MAEGEGGGLNFPKKKKIVALFDGLVILYCFRSRFRAEELKKKRKFQRCGNRSFNPPKIKKRPAPPPPFPSPCPDSGQVVRRTLYAAFVKRKCSLRYTVFSGIESGGGHSRKTKIVVLKTLSIRIAFNYFFSNFFPNKMFIAYTYCACIARERGASRGKTPMR